MITDYLKYIVDNKYLLFADKTKEQKTLIMKSMLRDKIIKYIYFIADNNPRATEKITDIAIGINEIKKQFFETPIEIENLPCNWEYWQKLSEDAAIKIDQLNQQEKEQQEQQKIAKEKRILERFVMAEINLLEKSHFIWTDLRLPNKARMAAGFEVWCCVLEYDGKWIAIGGSKSKTEPVVDTTILHRGNKLQALAAGNDFMNTHETNDTASKFAGWRRTKPTDKQRKWLPPQFKGVRKITKGDASAILTYQMQAQSEIHNVLSCVA